MVMEHLTAFYNLGWNTRNTKWKDCMPMILRDLTNKGLFSTVNTNFMLITVDVYQTMV